MKTKVIIALGLITLLLSSCSKEVNGNDEHHATAAFKYLTSNIWVSTETDISRIILFNDDYSHKYSFQINDYVEQMEGRYTFDESNNILKIYTETDYCFHDFKVYKLTSSELWLGSFNPITEEYDPVSIKCRRATNEDNIPDFFTNNKNEDNNNDNEQSSLNISSPVIQDIANTSAVIKGTILGDNIDFQDRGFCYSTTTNPSINDIKVSDNNNVINKTLTDLYGGTKYYVRLYALVNDKYYYGEQGSFTTLKDQTSSIIFSIESETANISMTKSSIEISATIPSRINYYGICYGKTPQPKITDYFVDEKLRETNWTLTELDCNSEYYARAYHIEGSRIIYYEDSEFKFNTIGDKMLHYEFNYDRNIKEYEGSYTLSITLSDFPNGIYEVGAWITYIRTSGLECEYLRPKMYVEVINNSATIEFSDSFSIVTDREKWISLSELYINPIDANCRPYLLSYLLE